MERALSDRSSQSEAQPLSLGQYRLLNELGRGGMGRVFKALHTIMGREVAIKVISPELVSDPVAVEWFRREVRASTRLNHPNIVMAYDANEAEGLHFLVMEYVHGITLDALVKQEGPLPIARACDLMRQTALGLQHAHEKGLVHRDIKPSNLLIPSTEGDPSPEVLVKILDFGLARLHGKSKGDTIAPRGESGVLGTPDCIAPEQSRDIHAADIRSDLYSLGCAFYFTLAGRVPFPGANALEKLIRHLTEEPEPLEKVRGDVPPTLAAIVRRLMAKVPVDRYQTPAEFVRELEKLSDALLKADRVGAAAVKDQQSDRSLSVAAPINSDSEPPHTCVLENVKVFAPSQGVSEPAPPSLPRPLEKSCPRAQVQANTPDTLMLSPRESAVAVTLEAEAENAPYLAAESAPQADTDRTLQEMDIAEEKARDALPSIDPVVYRLWRRWLRLLKTIIVGRELSRIDGDTYQTIHTLLLQACRAAVDSCPVRERRAFYEECLSITQPWFRLQSFAHADANMLDSLLARCHQIEVELNNGKAPWTARQGLALGLLTFSPVGAAMWYWYYGRLWLPSLFEALPDDFSMSELQSSLGFVQKHPALLLGVIFPLAIIFAVALLSRVPRT